MIGCAPNWNRCWTNLSIDKRTNWDILSQNGTGDWEWYPVRVIAKRALREFWEKHPDAEEALQAWYGDAERACWDTPADIRAVYQSASFLANNRVVFNIRGNRYRLVTQIHYNTRIVYIRFVGTHAEYDRIDALTL